MNIVKHYVEDVCVEQFADRHGLVMEITERHPNSIEYQCAGYRYYAFFHDFYIKESITSITCVVGNGNTPEEAIADYASRISGTRGVAYPDDRERRREFVVPNLVAG